MKQSEILTARITALEAELATARAAADAAKRDEAATGTSAERREYAQELYSKILDLESDYMDVESDAVDVFIERVIDPKHRKEIDAALSGAAFFGSRPIIQVCNDATLDKIISVLEACIDYIDYNGVLDMWLTYDPETNTIKPEDEEDDDPDFTHSAGFSIADREDEESSHHCDDPGCNCSI